MTFTDTQPKPGDSNNNLLGKILQEIRGNGDGIVGPQGPAGPAGADGIPESETITLLETGTGDPKIVLTYAGGEFRIQDELGNDLALFVTGVGWVFFGDTIFQNGVEVTGALTKSGVSVATVEAHSTLTYAATTDIDLAGDAFRTLTLTGGVTFTTSNRAAPRSVTLKITGGASDRSLAFPAWVFVGEAAPTSLAANKTAVLTITAFGTADTDIVAAWVVQP
jgi:hypothetical protein